MSSKLNMHACTTDTCTCLYATPSWKITQYSFRFLSSFLSLWVLLPLNESLTHLHAMLRDDHVANLPLSISQAEM